MLSGLAHWVGVCSNHHSGVVSHISERGPTLRRGQSGVTWSSPQEILLKIQGTAGFLEVASVC